MMDRDTDYSTDWFSRVAEKYVTRKTAAIAAAAVVLMCWSQPKLIGGLPWVAGFVGLLWLIKQFFRRDSPLIWRESALFAFALVFELWVILEIFRRFYPTYPTFPL